MDNVNQLIDRITAQPGESAQTCSESSPKSQQRKLALLVWQLMGSLYGHKWSSAYGDKADPDRVWEACMVDLTETQVRHGLRECVNSGLEWPPSAPEFRKLCTGETDTRWEHKQIERADREFAERMIPRMTEDRAAIARREMDKIRQSLGMPRREN